MVIPLIISFILTHNLQSSPIQENSDGPLSVVRSLYRLDFQNNTVKLFEPKLFVNVTHIKGVK